MTNHLQEGFYEWWSCAEAVLMHTASKTITSCLKPVDSVDLQCHWKHLKASESIWLHLTNLFSHLLSCFSWTKKSFIKASLKNSKHLLYDCLQPSAERQCTKLPELQRNHSLEESLHSWSHPEVWLRPGPTVFTMLESWRMCAVCCIKYLRMLGVGVWCFKEAVEFSLTMMFAHSLCQATAAPGLESFAPGSLEFQLQA